jgi:DNA-binding phage protein
MPNDTFGGAKTLLDALFHEKEQHLLNAFRESLERMDRRTQLAQVSGIHDEALLDRLMELNIEPETVAAMAVVPLVCIAWADGKVQEPERRAVLAAAKDAGVPPQNGRYPLLEYWLNERPEAALLEAWEHYIQCLCQRLDEREITELRCDLLNLARGVAETAGGLLGFGRKTSAAERVMLARLEQAFGGVAKEPE